MPVFALFDGHGGNGMSTKLVNELHLVIHQNLEDLLPNILEAWEDARDGRGKTKVSFVGLEDIEEQATCTWDPDLEELITGCLESAFWMMDKAALASRKEWKVIILTYAWSPTIFSKRGNPNFQPRCQAAAPPLWRFLSAIASSLPTPVTPERSFTKAGISTR